MLLVLTCGLAFYLAWNLGANDVANSMGTAVGSKALTLGQALAIAAILEFLGALLFGQAVSATLATQIINPDHFTPDAQEFITGMIVAVIACGIWLNIATLWGLPVSSSHAVVGAIAGFAWVASGMEGVAWRSIGLIAFTWVITPLISGAIAAAFYAALHHWLLDPADASTRLQEWIPWLSAMLVGTFGYLVLPITSKPGLTLGIASIVAVGITSWMWDKASDEPDAVESSLIPFQIISAGCVAFAHGANDVGNAIAPLAAIVYTQTTGTIPTTRFTPPLWILAIGGLGIVGGLAVWGKRVIATVGHSIIPLQPSIGFCAQMATALTVLWASRLGLPLSTSHAIVGSVVGIGLVQQTQEIQWQTLRGIAIAWGVTIPAAAGFAALIFSLFDKIKM